MQRPRSSPAGPRENRCELKLEHERLTRPANAGRRGSDRGQNLLHDPTVSEKIPRSQSSKLIKGWAARTWPERWSRSSLDFDHTRRDRRKAIEFRRIVPRND